MKIGELISQNHRIVLIEFQSYTSISIATTMIFVLKKVYFVLVNFKTVLSFTRCMPNWRGMGEGVKTGSHLPTRYSKR